MTLGCKSIFMGLICSLSVSVYAISEENKQIALIFTPNDIPANSCFSEIWWKEKDKTLYLGKTDFSEAVIIDANVINNNGEICIVPEPTGSEVGYSATVKLPLKIAIQTKRKKLKLLNIVLTKEKLQPVEIVCKASDGSCFANKKICITLFTHGVKQTLSEETDSSGIKVLHLQPDQKVQVYATIMDPYLICMQSPIFEIKDSTQKIVWNIQKLKKITFSFVSTDGVIPKTVYIAPKNRGGGINCDIKENNIIFIVNPQKLSAGDTLQLAYYSRTHKLEPAEYKITDSLQQSLSIKVLPKITNNVLVDLLGMEKVNIYIYDLTGNLESKRTDNKFTLASGDYFFAIASLGYHTEIFSSHINDIEKITEIKCKLSKSESIKGRLLLPEGSKAKITYLFVVDTNILAKPFKQLMLSVSNEFETTLDSDYDVLTAPEYGIITPISLKTVLSKSDVMLPSLLPAALNLSKFKGKKYFITSDSYSNMPLSWGVIKEDNHKINIGPGNYKVWAGTSESAELVYKLVVDKRKCEITTPGTAEHLNFENELKILRHK